MTQDASKKDFAEIVRQVRTKERAQSHGRKLLNEVFLNTRLAALIVGYSGLAAVPIIAGYDVYQAVTTEAPAATATPAPATPALSKRDSIHCTQGMRTAFNNESRQVNMTGETGVGMAASYGYDQNCRPFTLRFYDLFHAMLGRHDVLMNDSYLSSGYRFQVEGIRREISEDTQRYNMDTREGRIAVLELVNTRVNELFIYQSDDGTFYRSDYFASPIEAMQVGGGMMRGDCDDYATTKYIILRDLGFDSNTLFLSIVSRTEVNSTNHAVLMVNIEGSHPAQPRYQVLDNDAAARIVDSMASGYKTYMAFNGSGAYVFPQALHATGEIDLRFMTPERPYVQAPPRLKEDRVQARLS